MGHCIFGSLCYSSLAYSLTNIFVEQLLGLPPPNTSRPIWHREQDERKGANDKRILVMSRALSLKKKKKEIHQLWPPTVPGRRRCKDCLRWLTASKQPRPKPRQVWCFLHSSVISDIEGVPQRAIPRAPLSLCLLQEGKEKHPRHFLNPNRGRWPGKLGSSRTKRNLEHFQVDTLFCRGQGQICASVSHWGPELTLDSVLPLSPSFPSWVLCCPPGHPSCCYFPSHFTLLSGVSCDSLVGIKLNPEVYTFIWAVSPTISEKLSSLKRL